MKAVVIRVWTLYPMQVRRVICVSTSVIGHPGLTSHGPAAPSHLVVACLLVLHLVVSHLIHLIEIIAIAAITAVPQVAKARAGPTKRFTQGG